MNIIMASFYSIFMILSNVLLVHSYSSSEFVTQTVYGFLDFTTTIENTVMIFSPQSAPVLAIKKEIKLPTAVIETKPIVDTYNAINPTKLAEPINFQRNETQVKIKPKNSLMTQEIKMNLRTNTSVIILENDYPQPEYDLLSRQPAEYIEETYRVHNHRQNNNENVLESSINESRRSEVLQNTNYVKLKKNILRSSNSQVRLLKNTDYSTVISSTENQSQRNALNRSFTRKSNLILSTKTSHLLNSTSIENNRKVKKSRSRNKSKRRKNYQNSKSNSDQISKYTSETPIRRSFKTKVRPSKTEPILESSLKLNRAPGRWQYKSPPKPRVNIRNTTPTNPNNHTEFYKDNNLILNNIPNSSFSENFEHSLNKDIMNEGHSEYKDMDLWETLNIEISTATDYPDTYYEIATIKTPYIFQAGVVKKTRFVTITSTMEKVLTSSSFELTKNSTPENILTTPVDSILVESSIKTLDEIHLSNGETPSLETITDVLSTKIIKLKTQVLPFVYDSENITKLITLVHTFDISTFITATKTISPLAQSKFNPSQNFKDFSGILDEAGSEFNLEIDISNDENKDTFDGKFYSSKNILGQNNGNLSLQNDNSYDFSRQASFYNFPSMYISNSNHALQKPETIWETHIIPLVNGATTIYQTISKSVGIKEFPDILEDPMKFSQPMSINPYVVPNQLNFQTITSSIAQKTVVTQTNSKVLRLTFGAKTAYTTLFSTTVIPTEYTQVITTAVPFAPTAAFPGYFPPPYPFAYLG